jgi:hypothetical protein
VEVAKRAVAAAALAAGGQQDALAGRGQVGDEIGGFDVGDDRSNGDRDLEVLRRVPVLRFAASVLPAFSVKKALVAKG